MSLQVARDNLHFYEHCLVEQCLKTIAFERMFRDAAQRAKNHAGASEEITRVPFTCHTGETAHVEFKNGDALTYAETGIGLWSLALKISKSMATPTNERAEFSLITGPLEVSYQITEYKDPHGRTFPGTHACPEGVPLSRTVRLSINCES